MDRCWRALCRNFASVIRAGRGEDLRYPPSPLRRVSANLIRRSGKGPMLVDLILAEMEGRPKEDAISADLKPLFQDLRRILTPEFVREGFSDCDPLLGVLYDVADDPALVPRLIPLLQSECLLTRIYAGLTLGKLGAAEAVDPLLEVIRKGYAFSDSTAPASAKHTVNILNVDGKPQRQSQTVRWLGYLCTALGHIGTDDARLALESLATDPDAPRDVRYGSVIGLGHIGSTESLPALRKAAEARHHLDDPRRGPSDDGRNRPCESGTRKIAGWQTKKRASRQDYGDTHEACNDSHLVGSVAVVSHRAR